MRPEVCVGAVVRRGGEVLLIKRANPPQAGRWSLPGGRVEAGESLHDALRREVLEETGIRVDVVRFIDVVERVGVGHHFVILDYLAAPIDPADSTYPQAATDAADARWVDVHDLTSYDLSDGLLDFLRNHMLL
jgi:8-oxo-dGTP diphosphatase